jgi:cytochrome c biogenesis protein CcmG/thiol:disulfide interchange protein DsbE
VDQMYEAHDPSKTVRIPRRASRRSAPMKLLLCLSLAASAARTSTAASHLLHKAAPEFARTDLKNKRLDLRAYHGKVVLLNFWATWCAPCQLEMPRFAAWQSQYGARGLQIIGISMDDDPSSARSLVRKLKLNYPVAMGDETLGQLYGGVMGLPLTFLIDRHGKVEGQFQGEINVDSIEKKFKPLLHP